MPERDHAPLLEEGQGDDDHVYMLEDDAQYVMSERPTRYLYAPMSYEQAMAPQRSKWDPMYWYAIAKEHRHILDLLRPPEQLRIWIGRIGSGARMLWPQNRMHQTILIVFGLWILLSYVNWEVSEAVPKRHNEMTMGHHDYSAHLDEQLNDHPLKPRPGDGKEVERANWRHIRCYSMRRPLRYSDAFMCQQHWNFSMTAMPREDSLSSTDHSYIYVNPVLGDARDWYPQRRSANDLFKTRPDARAPAHVYIVSRNVTDDDPRRNEILVDVIATHDKNAWPLLTHAYVAKMSHGMFSDGLMILTNQPPHATYYEPHHDPLRFDILVSLPARMPVSGLSIDMREGHVYFLTNSAFANAKRIVRLVRGWPRTLFDWMYQSYKNFDLTSEEKHSVHTLMHQDHFFGRLNMHTQYGSIFLHGTIRASSEIIAKATHGVIEVAAEMYASFIYFLVGHGDVALRKPSQLSAHKIAHMEVQHGLVKSEEAVDVHGSKTTVKTHDGAIGGMALWHANFSMSMSATNGAIDAHVAVEKPMLVDVPYDDFLRTEQGRRVETMFDAHSGDVHVQYMSHTPGVPLKSIATSDTGSVDVALAANYEGRLRVQGASVAMNPSGMPAGRHFGPVDAHQAESPAWINGTVVWDSSARPASPPLPPEMPVHLEPGKTPLDYGAESIAISNAGKASMFIT